MFAKVDLGTDSLVHGVYTGFARALTPGDPSDVMFDDGGPLGLQAESTWPRSKGANAGARRSDLHHLFPARADVRAARGDKPFGEIPDAEVEMWYRLDQSQPTIPTTDIDQYSASSRDVFEPRQAHKRNAARAALYFYTIYENVADEAFLLQQAGTLILWNVQDPADGAEAGRTEQIAQYQGHFNPFVLDPTLAERAFGELVVATEDPADVPGALVLAPAYPNPFARRTGLTVSVGTAQKVEVVVYNMLGQRVAVLRRGLVLAGTTRIVFEAGGLPSGVYQIRATTTASTMTRTVLLLK